LRCEPRPESRARRSSLSLEFVGALMGFDMANLTLLRRRIGQLELAKDRGSARSRLNVVLNDMNPN
jgi:hypothetical protein